MERLSPCGGWKGLAPLFNGDENLHRVTGQADVDLLGLVGHAQFLQGRLLKSQFLAGNTVS